MPHDNTALLILPAEAGNSLLDVAKLEFQASLQLLADRACWISGAQGGAIAMKEDGVFSYCAVAGTSEVEPGTVAASGTDPLRECLASRRAVRIGSGRSPAMFCMAVPIIRDDEAIGFLDLTSDREFSEDSEDAVSRIAAMVAVTAEHRDAAERAEKLEFREGELELPSLWHAPDSSAQAERRVAERRELAEVASTQAAAPEVQACAACGFPVSPGRSLCVECEQKPESVGAAANLFKTEPEESWLSAHGYTIASLVVTALTAAIILWLRH